MDVALETVASLVIIGYCGAALYDFVRRHAARRRRADQERREREKRAWETIYRYYHAERERPKRRPWMRVFGVVRSERALKKKYRELAFQLHPDHGGSEDEMSALNALRDSALRDIRNGLV